jgi:hypothetical protein
MKKLLSIIGAFGLVATTSASVVSCGDPSGSGQKVDNKFDFGDLAVRATNDGKVTLEDLLPNLSKAKSVPHDYFETTTAWRDKYTDFKKQNMTYEVSNVEGTFQIMGSDQKVALSDITWIVEHFTYEGDSSANLDIEIDLNLVAMDKFKMRMTTSDTTDVTVGVGKDVSVFVYADFEDTRDYFDNDLHYEFGNTDPSVATIDTKGISFRVTGIKEGTTQMTIKHDYYEDFTFTVTVTE